MTRSVLPFSRLPGDRRGATLVEFAFVGPLLILMLIGAFDIAQSLYVSAVLQGAVQKAARDSTLEANSTVAAGALVDAQVKASVAPPAGIAPANVDAQIKTTRRFYRSFTLAAARTPETIVNDANHNNYCDPGESYMDANGNNVWDQDGGDANQGGAKDRTVYTVTVTYQRLFPLWAYVGVSQQQKLTASTVLENQPYDDQGTYSTTVQQKPCPTS